MYLDDVEYRVLRRLGSNELRKTRLRPPPDWLVVERPEPTGEDSTPAVAVDVFGGELQGLILAELSSNTVQTAPDLPVRLRPFAAREVTGEGDFGGGALARYGFPSPAAARDIVIEVVGELISKPYDHLGHLDQVQRIARRCEGDVRSALRRMGRSGAIPGLWGDLSRGDRPIWYSPTTRPDSCGSGMENGPTN